LAEVVEGAESAAVVDAIKEAAQEAGEAQGGVDLDQVDKQGDNSEQQIKQVIRYRVGFFLFFLLLFGHAVCYDTLNRYQNPDKTQFKSRRVDHVKFQEKYIIATSMQVKFWSFGAIEQTRKGAQKKWQDERNTLNDPRTFGPRVDLQCECKYYIGKEHENHICYKCGVKVTYSSVRWERFGHINLKEEVEYTLGNESQEINAFPVMPARYRESNVGRALNDHYEQIVECNRVGDVEGIKDGIVAIKTILLPLMKTAYGWGLPETDIIARGLVLTQPEEDWNMEVNG